MVDIRCFVGYRADVMNESSAIWSVAPERPSRSASSALATAAADGVCAYTTFFGYLYAYFYFYGFASDPGGR